MTAPSTPEQILGTIPISDHEFELLRSLIYQRAGINLTNQKRNMLVTRLNSLLKKAGFTNFQSYYDFVISDYTGKGWSDLLDAISTNHTFFFREKEHFDYMCSTVLPNIVNILRKKRNLDLRVWCAASSTGEEPYVLAMLLMEYFGSKYREWKAGLLATDISKEALDIAQLGIYSEDKISNIPIDLRNRYFNRLDQHNWQVKPFLKQEVTFRRFNLMNPQFPFKKPFHIIFCRNVMIYFDPPTTKALVNRLFQWTETGGYLFIGHSESLGRFEIPYRYVQPAVYLRD